MSPVHEHVASLLGAWALGACSEDETRLIMDHVRHCPACEEESLLLGGTAELLGGAAPGPSLRERTLAGARARRPAAPSVPDYAAPYAAQVSLLDALLTELQTQDWSTTVIDDWSVQDVVAHLSATDGLVAEQLEVGARIAENAAAEIMAELLQARMARADGAHRANDGVDAGGASDTEPADSDDERSGHGVPADEGAPEETGTETPDVAAAMGTEQDVLARTARLVARERAREPHETRTAWRAQAEALCARLDEDMATDLVRIRFPMKLASALVQRAFETWIHARDIAAATGRSLPSPLPGHLHAMASLGVRGLPAALILHEGRPADGESVHIDLQGPGGGEWDLPLGSAAPDKPTVTLALDAMDFCLLAGDRLPPGRVRAELGGDVPLGRRLLAAAPAFAGP
ncbi:maleylpyruvate isomerase N-terminal domain-containing protein [Actinomadura graeca]|uniref:Maleylpyruvate isomerase N-terminal domain-containing protein n=1 Tax=Actinomadura graeca TaxID=2750812 RepID=A0ABX8R7T4_9ACTN|nr:maleylpyruvate isomerase N-terminal domain-containing protein [Actinomadura graeca]QXJ26509.1 maleylpyruvate isomerase N-terminal domain-containing protein [Actinomadura graeca]